MSWFRDRVKELCVPHAGGGVAFQYSSAGRLADGSQGGESPKVMEPVASAAGGELEGGVRFVKFPVWRAVWVHRAVLAVAIAVGLFVEFNLPQFLDAYARWPQTKIPDPSSRFSAWDGAHYLILSTDGYMAGSHSCAFYPLWPAAIRAASYLTFGSYLLAGLLLANGLSLAALWFFYRVIARAYFNVDIPAASRL